MKPIPIGERIDGSDLSLNIETLLRTRLLIQASSGAGKTETLRLLCEQLSPKVPVIAFDPEGELSPLRAVRPFVLVGPGGDTPAMVRTAPLLAHRLLELGASAILDIYELPPHQRHEFVRDYINALIDAPKNLWKPLFVMVDEAHIYAPEKGMGESVALGAMADLASRGRKRGFAAIFATQRLAKLSKNVAAECQNVMIGRTTQIDQARALDTLNINGKANRDALARNLGRLDIGTFFAYGTAFDSQEPELVTMRRAESAPAPGVAGKYKVPPPPKAIADLLPKLADLPAEAEAKAKTEKELRDEVRELKRQLADVSKVTNVTQSQIKPEREKMLLETINTLETNLASTKKTAGAYEKAMTGIYHEADAMVAAATTIKGIVDAARQTVKDAPQRPAPVPAPKPTFSPGLRGTPPAVATAPHQKSSTEGLTGPEQRILDALAWFSALGIIDPQESAAAFIAGYKPGGGAWNNPKSRLRMKGLIATNTPMGTMRLSSAGHELARPSGIPQNNEGLQAAVMGKLDGPERKILAPLIAKYPAGLTKPELGDASGYAPSGGAFNNPISRLRTLGLITTRESILYAEPLLFPEG